MVDDKLQLGKVRMSYVGNYDSTKKYNYLDVVIFKDQGGETSLLKLYEGYAFLCHNIGGNEHDGIKETIFTEDNTINSDYWIQVSVQGQKGDTGEKGDKGFTGDSVKGISILETTDSDTDKIIKLQLQYTLLSDETGKESIVTLPENILGSAENTFIVSNTQPDINSLYLVWIKQTTSGNVLYIRDKSGELFKEIKSITGRGIYSITKTSSSDLTDTYTITYTDNTTSTFTITNGAKGRGIDSIEKKLSNSIEKKLSSGIVDTYTINYSDGSTSEFTVTNGLNADAMGIKINNTGVPSDITTVNKYSHLSTDKTLTYYETPYAKLLGVNFGNSLSKSSSGLDIRYNSSVFSVNDTSGFTINPTGSITTGLVKAKQMKCGSYEYSDNNVFTIGNGTSESLKSNALVVNSDGDLLVKGSIKSGCSKDSTGGTYVAKGDANGVAEKSSLSTLSILSNGVKPSSTSYVSKEGTSRGNTITGGYYRIGDFIYVNIFVTCGSLWGADYSWSMIYNMPKPSNSILSLQAYMYNDSESSIDATLTAAIFENTDNTGIINVRPTQPLKSGNSFNISGLYYSPQT